MLKLVVCRRASDPLRSGSVTGYQCALCGKELAVSPKGVQDVKSGGIALCGPCGFAAARDTNVMEVEVNPNAAEEFLRRLKAMRHSEGN